VFVEDGGLEGGGSNVEGEEGWHAVDPICSSTNSNCCKILVTAQAEAC
jgi:hypothetical protein